MFFDREIIIKNYEDKIDLFLRNKWQNTYNLGFLGLRRTGKTTLIRHLLKNYSKDILTFYFDFSLLNTTPLNFSNQIIYELFAKIDNKNYVDLDEIRINQTKTELLEIIKKHQNIILKGNNFQIIDSTFSIITALSKYHKMIIAFDEFQDLLDFRNFKELKNIDSIFRSHLLEQDNVFYVISGSYPEIIKDLILNPKNKLYSHFEVFEIGNFDKKTSYEYIKYINEDLDTITLKNIYIATNGNPYLLSILSSKNIAIIDFEDVIKQELFNDKGQIYNHFLYILESSIGKVGKTTTLNAILREVSIIGEYKIGELSKKIGISSQLIGKELKKLLKISILYQDIERNIKFRDYLFRFFCYYYYSSFETYQIDSHKFYIDKIEELSNKLSKVSSELGRTKEYELYYEIKERQGNQWNGIKLPLFRKIQKNYFTTIGDEIDLYCETIKGKKRIFELKYKSKAIGNKEIEKFISKMQADKYIYISKSGWSENIDEKYRKDKSIVLVSL